MTSSITQDTIPHPLDRRRVRAAVEAGVYVGMVALVAASAVVTKEATGRSRLEPLSAVSRVRAEGVVQVDHQSDPLPPVIDPLSEDEARNDVSAEMVSAEPKWGPEVRWFNARPVRPARTIWMTVTAYSPDARSCGKWADGITSSIHNVHTNGGKLVAADSRVLPLGSMVSVPGYDQANVVPVLDRGGAIKGNKLDLLFPTHEAARKWGVRHLPVTVWEYADGKPADDYRKVRDSRN
ncbi:MAG: 3D domain-containing protein [Phycisphaerales bacterium]